MGLLNTKASITHTTRIAAGAGASPIPLAVAVRAVQDAEAFMRGDLNYLAHTQTDADGSRTAAATLPAAVAPRAAGATQYFQVTDAVPARFARLLPPGSATVTNYYEITPLVDGVYAVIRSAMGVWVSREVRVAMVAEDELDLTEVICIECSRLLFGTVKGQNDENWERIHQGWAKQMGGQVTVQ